MKYMGSKQRIADDILSTIYTHAKPTDTFVDLFCGGCSVIERVDPTKYNRIANDKNIFLIEMFKALVSGKEYSRIITKDAYSARRDLYNLSKRHLVLTDEDYAEIGWYGWMGSFNGRFFSGGYAGHEVQTKNGTTRDYIREQIDNTLRQIPALKGVDFRHESYTQVLIPDRAIVYCDIPYRGTKQYETSKDFNYEAFYGWCRMNRHRYQIFVSEYDMPDDFECIWQKSVTTTINPNKTLKPVEKLFKIC